MMGSFFFHFSLILLPLFVSFFLITSSFNDPHTLKVVDIERPILDLYPSLLLENSNTQLRYFQQRVLCQRRLQFGLFLLMLSKYSSIPMGLFVRWTTRAIGTTFVFQSTLDIPLALGALLFCVAVCKTFSTIESHLKWYLKMRSSPERTIWANVSVNGEGTSPYGSSPQTYSTFHYIDKKNFTKEEWDDFTSTSTKQALVELAASKEFIEWFIEHPDRTLLLTKNPDYRTKQALVKWARSLEFISWFIKHPDRIKLFLSKSSDEDNRK